MKINPDDQWHPMIIPDGASARYEGISIRAHFAAMAMQGLLACDVNNQFTSDQVADFAIEQADVLIAKLNNTTGE